MDWIKLYPKSVKPPYSGLIGYFDENIRALFLRFDKVVNEKYGVFNKWHRFDKTHGWIYGYCRNYRVELFYITVKSNSFTASGVEVSDEITLQKAFDTVDAKYNAGYEKKYAQTVEKKRKKQIEITKIRMEREKAEKEKLLLKVDESKLNKFNWCKKISRNELFRLYKSEAQGMLDTELLDEVGYAFYTRCRQAREARICMEKGEILCHHCGAAVKTAGTAVWECECCYLYTYREYRRSYMAVNMPGNRAAPVFEKFEAEWLRCEDAGQKMTLIDCLIHECHVTLMSDAKGKSVCVNLIEGTKKQIANLLQKLATDKNPL